MNKFKLMLAAAVLPLLALTGCDKDDNTPDADNFMTIATLDSNTESGTVFTTRAEGDSPLITFTSSRTFDKKDVIIGNRYLLAYTNASGKRLESGPITLFGLMKIFNGKAQEATAEEIAAVTSSPYSLGNIQRSGQFVDIYATAPLMIDPVSYGLYVDKATVNDEVPEMYIGFVSDAPNSMTEKSFYASFDLSPVWNLPTCKGVRLHYKKNGTEQTTTFSKGQLDIKPVE